MNTNKFILFDCMETIIDLYKLPDLRDYAFWAFDGSGVEELWEDFDEFFRYYLLARSELSERLHKHQEHEISLRFLQLVRQSFPDMPPSRLEYVTGRLGSNYWRNYKAACYIKVDVASAIPRLAESYRLGIVSNFMVMDGIEELLEINGVSRYFDVIVTSVKEGWRKPHPVIYKAALERIGATAEDTVFVGDDYVNDFITPAELGMKPIYLDRYGRHPEVKSRVKDFSELLKFLSR